MTKKAEFQIQEPVKVNWGELKKEFSDDDLFYAELKYEGDKILVSWAEDGIVKVMSKLGRKLASKRDKFVASRGLAGYVVEGVLQKDGYFIVTDILVADGVDIREAPRSFRKDKQSDFAKKVQEAYPKEYGDRIGFPKMFECTKENQEEVMSHGYGGIICKRANGIYGEKEILNVVEPII